jgi:SAM-dependent methyltransferase
VKLYEELASWWSLISPPEDYREEAAFFRDAFLEACARTPRTLLELGSGGGHTASHLKDGFQVTLVDRAPKMLSESRARNPECEHVEGDMRAVRIGRRFDAVLVHDAVMEVTALGDLRQVVETAFVHCEPGGAALFVPDAVAETFRASTTTGGSDGPSRGVRYLEWTWDPDPEDSTFEVEMVFLLRESGAPVRVVHDHHVRGLFPRETWMSLLQEAGFRPRAIPFEGEGGDPTEIFVGCRPQDHSPAERIPSARAIQ